jgi:NADP-dependent 3-hydroxy acid dehydrogenase YdfG
MAKTIILFGYGPGISAGVAEKFGKEGFQVALVGRTQAKLDAGVKDLGAKGIKAQGFTADLNDPAATTAVVGKIREALGPIAVLEWTAYTLGGGNLLTAKPEEVSAVINIATGSLIAAVQASLADLKAEKGAVLITNGGFAYNDPAIDGLLVKLDSASLGIANAAKHKLAGILHQQLQGEGVYVGELVIGGTVKGTAWDDGKNPNALDPAAIGGVYWDLYRARKDWSIKYPA